METGFEGSRFQECNVYLEGSVTLMKGCGVRLWRKAVSLMREKSSYNSRVLDDRVVSLADHPFT